ncbi:sensor histidine kinase [Oceanobacillus chungangensis]|uniref:histidine kinase n=1 Tax=Oceanobacillus chungangensis TaxID=1229152 RepID=A0A3D8PWQ8_9BACI|nr:sensor histidine kinase [Oceanobacillus chungangensis]RDW19977.1 histidine kinase [Oceanobacillus chungangensis]
MFKQYLAERRGWIFLFLSLQALFLIISYVDSDIQVSSILYIVFLSFIVFILFLIVRYNRETAYYKSLKEWYPGVDTKTIRGAERPLEKIVERALRLQTESYRLETSQNLTEIEQEKDDLLSWIHEVKTPLTTMQLMIERVEEPVLKSQLMNEWLRIHLLLDQQLHHKKIPFMENDVYVEKASLEQLIFTEIKALQSWCFQKGIGFDVSFEIKEVLTDTKWLGFMVRQLLTNAIKYSEEADIKIHSFMRDSLVHLQIKDAGRGIDPRDLPRIFDKGFTSTKNHKDNAATGMGLYLTKKVAAELNIHIEVQSKLNEGTTFTLSFAKKNDFLKLTSM